MDTLNLGRYEATWKVIQPQTKSSNRGVYHLKCEWGEKGLCVFGYVCRSLAIWVLFGLFVVVDTAQDITDQIKGSCRFLNSTYIYINKKTLWPILLLMVPKCGMIYLGPISQRDLSPDLDLNLRLWS